MKVPHRVVVVEDRWATARHVVETIAIVAAGLWAFYTFIYQERIKPASEPAALGIAVSFHRLGRDATRDIVVFSATFRNTGKTQIDIAADGFDVWGIRYGKRRSASPDVSHQPDLQAYREDIPMIDDHLLVTSMELRGAAAGGANRHITLEPDAEITLEHTIVVRRGEYDTLIGSSVAIPVKTPVAHPIPIRIVPHAHGGLWLHADDPDHGEDDNLTEFALIP